jgi:hypothetical protein
MKDDSLVSTERVEAIKSACVGGESTMIFVNTAESAEDFLYIAEERYLDLDLFCDALKETKKKELITLAGEIQIAVLKNL